MIKQFKDFALNRLIDDLNRLNIMNKYMYNNRYSSDTDILTEHLSSSFNSNPYANISLSHITQDEYG